MKLRNVFVQPRVVLERDEADPASPYTRVSFVQVEGLVCDAICATRARQGLEGLPGITQVRHTPGSSRFIVEYQGEAFHPDRVQAAVLSQVVALWLRKLLEHMRTVRLRTNVIDKLAIVD